MLERARFFDASIDAERGVDDLQYDISNVFLRKV